MVALIFSPTVYDRKSIELLEIRINETVLSVVNI